MRRRSAVALAGCLLALAAAVVAWRDGGATDASPPPAPPPAEVTGTELFVARGCASCHDGPLTTAPVAVGPPLAAAATWAGERRPGLGAEAYLAQSIRDPSAFRSPAVADGAQMPVLGVTDAEVDALVEYLLER